MCFFFNISRIHHCRFLLYGAVYVRTHVSTFSEKHGISSFMRGDPVTAQREDKRGKYSSEKMGTFFYSSLLGNSSEPGPPV